VCDTAGACVDDVVVCDDDRDCAVPGQRCTDVAAGRRCAFAACAPDGSCEPSAHCFNASCVVAPPCDGACPGGEVCITPRDRCAAPPAGAVGCDVTCDAGTVLVVRDPARMLGAGCIATACECASLPPLAPGDVGRFSAVAVARGEAIASAYDARYGDLVVVRFDDEGRVAHVDHVDGVPDTGRVLGARDGLRGGIADPGPDVGRYTSVAIDAEGWPRVAYHGVDSTDLRFAWFDGTRWQHHVVEGEAPDEDVGRHTSLVLDAGGLPHIACFAPSVPGDGGAPVTALLYARARIPTPATADDWVVMRVDTAAPPERPCGAAGCGAGESCVRADGNTWSCITPDRNCASDCGSDEACVGGSCRPAFVDAGVVDLPEGVGLFTSIAMTPAGPVIAYYDRLRGNLKLARASGTAPATAADWAVEVIDGEAPDGRDTGDVGQFASLAFDGHTGSLALAYADATRDDLRFLRLDGTGQPPVVVDDGMRGTRSHLVGADASLAFDAQGNAVVVYQDGTDNDLMIATLGAGAAWGAPRALRSDGAWGFYADVAIEGAVAYVTSFRFGYDARRRPANEIVLVKDPIMP
jgi:hypothetical protein